jgi:hypothetical protein
LDVARQREIRRQVCGEPAHSAPPKSASCSSGRETTGQIQLDPSVCRIDGANRYPIDLRDRTRSADPNRPAGNRTPVRRSLDWGVMTVRSTLAALFATNASAVLIC